MERCSFLLRDLMHFAEHFRRTGKIEFALRLQLAQRCQHVMRTVDVRVHRRESVRETFPDKRLRREVVALIKLITTENVKDAGVAFQASGMKGYLVQQMLDAIESASRIFESHAPHQPMHFIAEREQKFGQVTAVLAGKSCY